MVGHSWDPKVLSGSIALERCVPAGIASSFCLPSDPIGRYHPERVLSVGAMGAVVTAREWNGDELVVIKLLHPEQRFDPVPVARIRQEARALAEVASEHVVRLLGTGWSEPIGPYLVLEYLEGIDLCRMLEQSGPLPLAVALDYLLQACDALGVAHAAGIVHLDVKPENFFVVASAEARLKLLDFGISRHLAPSPLVKSGGAGGAEAQLVGTPSYMSPERLLEHPDADHRSDIWSLGVVLHELLTGRSLFGSHDVEETCARIVRNAPVDLEPNRTVLPAPIRAIIARCLARSPEQRFQSVQELAAHLYNAMILPDRWRGFLTGVFRRD
jgi:serine/threonine-protein kinase